MSEVGIFNWWSNEFVVFRLLGINAGVECVDGGVNVLVFLMNSFVNSRLCSKAMLLGCRGFESSIHLLVVYSCVFQ